MEKAPKSLRLQIALMGRVNSGKSSFLNLVTGQEAAITSDIAGTTTDVVEKIRSFCRSDPSPGWIRPVSAIRPSLAASVWPKPAKSLIVPILLFWCWNVIKSASRKNLCWMKPRNAKRR